MIVEDRAPSQIYGLLGSHVVFSSYPRPRVHTLEASSFRSLSLRASRRLDKEREGGRGRKNYANEGTLYLFFPKGYETKAKHAGVSIKLYSFALEWGEGGRGESNNLPFHRMT